MLKFSEIYEGWKNDLFPDRDLKDFITKVSEERLNICKSCKAYSESGEGCSIPGTAPCCNSRVIVDGVRGCGCPLKKKTKCLSCGCPAKKWEAVSSSDQEELIDQKLKEDGEN
jgi:hypothetical protein